eukprot:5977962-Pyramimonas_sp.AAC.1
MLSEIAEMRQLLNCVKSEAPSMPAPVSQAFNRNQNPRAIVARAQALVAAAKVSERIGPRLSDCNLDVDDWGARAADGPAARRFRVTIRGAAGHAARE